MRTVSCTYDDMVRLIAVLMTVLCPLAVGAGRAARVIGFKVHKCSVLLSEMPLLLYHFGCNAGRLLQCVVGGHLRSLVQSSVFKTGVVIGRRIGGRVGGSTFAQRE